MEFRHRICREVNSPRLLEGNWSSHSFGRAGSRLSRNVLKASLDNRCLAKTLARQLFCGSQPPGRKTLRPSIVAGGAHQFSQFPNSRKGALAECVERMPIRNSDLSLRFNPFGGSSLIGSFHRRDSQRFGSIGELCWVVFGSESDAASVPAWKTPCGLATWKCLSAGD